LDFGIFSGVAIAFLGNWCHAKGELCDRMKLKKPGFSLNQYDYFCRITDRKPVSPITECLMKRILRLFGVFA